jgi:hypothetical protein
LLALAYFFALLRIRRKDSTATNANVMAAIATIMIVSSLRGLTGIEFDGTTAPIVNPFQTPSGAGKFEAAYACPLIPAGAPSIQPFPTAAGATSPTNVMEVREVQDSKAAAPIDVTPLPIVAEVREVQDWNAWAPMVVTLFGMVMEAREVQAVNDQFPIDVTLLGMVTKVTKCPWTLLKALSPMAPVTFPPNVEGMVMAPPVPVYPVIVAFPLLVV